MKVLLLHAWPPDEHMWERQVGTLRKAGHEPVAPRLYGRGPSIEDWAGQLLTEVDGPFVAVGASMGGYCALALARRASERVPGLVLVGSRAAADTDERRAFRDELVERLRSEGVPRELETDVDAESLAVAQVAMRDEHDALTFELRRPIGELLDGGRFGACHADGGAALLGDLFELGELLSRIAGIDLNMDHGIIESDRIGDFRGVGVRRAFAVDIKQPAPLKLLEHRLERIRSRPELGAHMIGDADIARIAGHKPL